MQRYSLDQAKEHFERIVTVEAQEGPVLIERADGFGVVVVSLTAYSQLRSALHTARETEDE